MNWRSIQFCRYEDREDSEMLFKSDSSKESETSFVMKSPLTKLEKMRHRNAKFMQIKQDEIDREIDILEGSNLSEGEKNRLIARRLKELQQMKQTNLSVEETASNKEMKSALTEHYKVRDDVDHYGYSLNGHGVSPWMKNDKEDWYRTQTIQVEGLDHPVLRFFNTSDFAGYIQSQSQFFIKSVKDDLFRDEPEITDQELIEKFQDFLNVQIGNQ